MEKNKNKNKLKFNKNTIIICICFVLFTSVIFNQFFNYSFKLYPNLSNIDDNGMQVHFVDVGQGDATLIKFPNNQTMIIDSGSIESRDKLTHYIDNVFFQDGYNKFDYVVLTHSDSDHSGNMGYIIENYNVDTVFRPHIYSQNLEVKNAGNFISVNNSSYDKFIISLTKKGLNVEYNEIGKKIISQNNQIYLQWLSPSEQSYTDINDFSPIMLVEYNDKRICLTGDATSNQELDVLSKFDLPNIDVLKAGHHGSDTSTCYDFLNKLKPKFVVISENSYDFPAEQTLDNILFYDKQNDTNLFSNILNTCEQGNIICYINSNQDVSFEYIKNVYDYFYVQWYVIVIITSILLLGSMLIPKQTKRKTKR